jgi:hypothetical protein
MRTYHIGLAAFAAISSVSPAIIGPAMAQEEMGEIIVTAQRTSGDYFSNEQTVIGLRRPADSALQSVIITSDSRDEDVRKREIHAMMENALKRSAAASVVLVTGDFELQEITMGNYKDLPFTAGNRADTSTVSFYVKSKLAGSTGGAQGRIDSFINGVAPSGRSLLEKQGELTLTIVNPDQYRDQIIKLIAAESLKYAGFFGPDYGVDIAGLNEQLSWAQASGTEVFLYIPYRFNIRPK